MANAKTAAAEMMNLYRTPRRSRGNADLVDLGATLPSDAPHLWDATENGTWLLQPRLINKMKSRWGISSQAETLRTALFVGCLDDLLALHGCANAETLIRYFDELTSIDQIEPITSFLGGKAQNTATMQTNDSADLWGGPDPDILTKNFLRDCYAKDDRANGYDPAQGFALPEWAGPHEQNTKGAVRALAWLHVPPVLKIGTDNIEHYKFPLRDGRTIQLVGDGDQNEAEKLKLARVEQLTHASGSGVNDFSPFVWCNLSLTELKNTATKASDILASIAEKHTPELGKVELDLFALDDVGLKALAKKAAERGVVGPLRLSANALLTDPTSGSLIIQEKKEKARDFPRHLFGGGFRVGDPQQRGTSYVPSDGADLVRCVRREVLEESNIALPMSSRQPYRDIPTLLLLQTDPPFLQTSFLGWEVPLAELEVGFTSKAAETGADNEEGTALRLALTGADKGRLQSVAEIFVKGKWRRPWRPAGLLSLYAWYCCDFPGLREEAKKRLRDHLTVENWPRA